jgi:acetyl esterase
MMRGETAFGLWQGARMETSQANRDRISTDGAGRRWGRGLVTLVAAILTFLTLMVAVGALFPRRGLLATIGTLAESFFALHVLLAGLVAIGLAMWARRLGGRRGAAIILVLALLATAGAAIPFFAQVRLAHREGASISWAQHLRVLSPARPVRPDETKMFATVDGKTLDLDVYLPKETGNPAAVAPVVMIHGGGYSRGERSDGRDWDHWFAEHHYAVFDVDYRLDPPLTWNLAAPDVACAMAWIAAHADDYHLAIDRMLITGQSAGGGLALQVAYGLGDGSVASSCGGNVPQPKAVFALYPPEDFALAWHLDTGITPATARILNTGYIGGSPEQFPDRYRTVSAVFHVRPGLPPTLVAAGLRDHLVPYAGHEELAEKLNAAGVPNELLGVPYSEHAYDLAWGGIGGQITRQVVADFLARYLPATATQ